MEYRKYAFPPITHKIILVEDLILSNIETREYNIQLLQARKT